MKYLITTILYNENWKIDRLKNLLSTYFVAIYFSHYYIIFWEILEKILQNCYNYCYPPRAHTNLQYIWGKLILIRENINFEKGFDITKYKWIGIMYGISKEPFWDPLLDFPD